MTRKIMFGQRVNSYALVFARMNEVSVSDVDPDMPDAPDLLPDVFVKKYEIAELQVVFFNLIADLRLFA